MNNQSAEYVAITIVICALAGVTGWIISVIASSFRQMRSSRDLVNLHGKLLDRFSNSSELIAYLEGDAGRRFFESLTIDGRDSISRILNSMQAGLVLFLLGVGLVALRSTQDEAWLRQILLLAGTPTATVGAGLLISSFIAFRLCKSWGVMRERGSLDRS